MKVRIYIVTLMLLSNLGGLKGQVVDSSKVEEKFWIAKMDVWNPWFAPVSYDAMRFGVEFEKVYANNRALSPVLGAEYYSVRYTNPERVVIGYVGLRYYPPIFRNLFMPGEGLFVRGDVLPGLYFQTPPCFDWPVPKCDPSVLFFMEARIGLGAQKSLGRWYFSASGTAGYSFTQPTFTAFVLVGRKLR